MIRSSNLSTLSAARFGCTALAVALAGGGLISAATSAQSLPPLNVEPVWTLPVPPAPPEARATGSARFSAIAVDSGVLLLDANGLQNNIDRDQNVMPGVSFGLFSSRPPLLIDSRGEFAFVRREYDDRGNSALTQIGFNGRVNWSLPFTVSSNSLAPFTDGGAVALHRGGTLHHLRASDGRIAWSVAPTDVQSLTPGAEFKSLIATESGVLIHASVERIAEDGTLEQTSSLVRLDRAGPTRSGRFRSARRSGAISNAVLRATVTCFWSGASFHQAFSPCTYWNAGVLRTVCCSCRGRSAMREFRSPHARPLKPAAARCSRSLGIRADGGSVLARTVRSFGASRAPVTSQVCAQCPAERKSLRKTAAQTSGVCSSSMP